jgi:hypothetical protein
MKILVIGAAGTSGRRRGRALAPGFTAGTCLDDIIRVRIEDALNNRLQEPA